MKTIATILTIVSILLISCAQSTSNNNASTTNNSTQIIDTLSLKVYVNQQGTITVNGTIVTLWQLDTKMQHIKNKKGVIFYSRDNQQADPPKESIQVMEIIVKYSLPLKFFSDSTFTQVVEFN